MADQFVFDQDQQPINYLNNLENMSRDQSPTRNLEELLGLSASAKPKSELTNHKILDSAAHFKDVHDQISATLTIIGNKLNDLTIEKERIKNKYLAMPRETETPHPQQQNEDFSIGLSEIQSINEEAEEITKQQIEQSQRQFLQKCWELEDRINKMEKFGGELRAKNSSMKAQWAREVKQVNQQSMKWSQEGVQTMKTGLMQRILETERKTKTLLKEYIEKQEYGFQSLGNVGVK